MFNKIGEVIQLITNLGIATTPFPILIVNGDGTIPGGGSLGPDVMLKSIYDVNTNSKVDNVEKVAVEVIASESISKYQLVTVDGTVADSSNLGDITKIVGVSLEDADSGDTIMVQTFGEIVDNSWSWSSGPLFLNSTSLSQTPPTSGFLLFVGIAQNTHKVLISIQDAIKL